MDGNYTKKSLDCQDNLTPKGDLLKKNIILLLVYAFFSTQILHAQKEPSAFIMIKRLYYLLSDGTKRADPLTNIRVDLQNIIKNRANLLAAFKPEVGHYRGVELEIEPNIYWFNGKKEHIQRLKKSTIKIEGAFEVPKNAFYTYTLHWNGKELLASKTEVLKLTLLSSHALFGIFYYVNPGTKKSFTLKLIPPDRIETILQIKPTWVISGSYEYKSEAQRVQLMPSTAQCPSCNSFKNFLLKALPIPDPVAYKVVAFGEDFIDIINETDEYVHMKKGTYFKLYTDEP